MKPLAHIFFQSFDISLLFEMIDVFLCNSFIKLLETYLVFLYGRFFFFYKVASRLHVAGEYFKNKIQNKFYQPQHCFGIAGTKITLTGQGHSQCSTLL